ncbi:VTC domain-containing protein [Actinotalea subterranea]|uniref:VTC domain-containing protein n=1 Tax=Actinotalea subterranea TaxID=2607497 RepID=UPI001FE3350F|nr:VTC domain-containing protein [Actinotalea subterranea]
MPLIEQLPAIDLERVQALADLQTRVDRKYVLTTAVLDRLAQATLADAAVLTIDGRTAFGYESVYFDTPDLLTHRAAAHERRRRYKVRTRTYLDSGTCVLELKTRGARDETVKRRVPHPVDRRAELTADDVDALREWLGVQAPVDELRPSLRTTYRRCTVVDVASGARLTVDSDLRLAAPEPARGTAGPGAGSPADRLPAGSPADRLPAGSPADRLPGGSTTAGAEVVLRGRLVLEIKSAGPATPADRWLWAAGHRPERISKYSVGLAALDPTLPANRWARSLTRHFGAGRA